MNRCSPIERLRSGERKREVDRDLTLLGLLAFVVWFVRYANAVQIVRLLNYQGKCFYYINLAVKIIYVYLFRKFVLFFSLI